MTDLVSNRTGEYLALHAEIETEGAALPYRQLPEYKAFEKRWEIVLERLTEFGLTPTQHERNIAENWFMWGWCSGKLLP